MGARKTPVMQQHAAAKRAYPDAVIFFRLGDFYEMFEEDAVLCARLLDLTLTSRNKGKPDEVPMAGVPHHSAHAYIGKLLELGHKVAICEQMADPTTVKGIVPRQVVRVLTPGTVTEGEHLEADTNNWLAAVDAGPEGTGVALLDLSTGELRAAVLPDVAAVLGELSRAAPREVVVGLARPDDGEGKAIVAAIRAAVPGAALRQDEALDETQASETLRALDADARRLGPPARRAVARALRYARACNPLVELPVRRIVEWDPSSRLIIDQVAQRHLELVESPSGGRDATLLSVLDATETPPGARLLRQRLLAPLREVARIRRRLDAVELFVVNPRLRAELRKELAGVGDLERLAVRASLGEAKPRDLGALRDGLLAARRAVGVLSAVEDGAQREILGLAGGPPDTVSDLADELLRALVERPPAQQKEGAIFQPEYDAELSELDTLRRTGAERMVELEARLREETGIHNLKVRYTRVFGWYIEASRSQVGRVPESWRRKQTVATGERYTMDELDDLADRIATAEERHRQRELALLSELTERVQACTTRITELSARVARWDTSAALAEVAHRHDYTQPHVDASSLLKIEDGRHPVVERLAAAGRFVPNDVRLDLDGERLWIVTGPNMAGKSTLLRQTALAVVLAQMGSYVPARAARIGVVDRVLSRVGASDNLARGESTFMVEMRETAEILRRATSRSLVILDEIGRGTSTFDGLAIAWAVAEHLDDVVGCRVLFATHYHELTALADRSPNAANVSVSAKELDGDIVFLHRLVRGAASRSYGVEVAKLAGLPESVLARSRAVLASLEAGAAAVDAAAAGTGSFMPEKGRKRRVASDQLDLFSPGVDDASAGDIVRTLRALDVDRLTPLEALQLVAQLKGRAG